MLWIFRKWPNTTIAAISAAVFAITYLWSISNRAAVPSQPHERVNTLAMPPLHLPAAQTVDYIFFQDLR